MRERATFIVEQNAVLREALRQTLIGGGWTVAASVGSIDDLADHQPFAEKTTVVLSCPRGADQVEKIRRVRALDANIAVVVLGGAGDSQSTLAAIRSGARACLDDSTDCETFLRSLELAARDLVVMSVASMMPAVHDAAELPAQDVARSPAPRAWKEVHRSAPVVTPLAPAGSASAPGRAAGTGENAAVRETCEADNVGAAGAGAGREPGAMTGGDLAYADEASAAHNPSLTPREGAILRLLQDGAPNKLIARQLNLTEATVKVHLKSILRKIRVKNRTQAAVWAMAHDFQRTGERGGSAAGAATATAHVGKGAQANGTAGLLS